VSYNNTAACTTLATNPNSSSIGTAITNPSAAFAVINSTRTYGNNADATAAAEFEKQFPYGAGTCPTNHTAVLATDQNFPDALSGSYVSGRLATGILLTPTASLSSETATALRLEGIRTVYVMGGPLAVSSNVISQIKATPQYNCGGATQVGGTPAATITVIVIAGQNRYGTAQAAAEYFGTGGVGHPAVPGAYGTTYNDTSGKASTTGPSTAGNTAVLATGTNFRDAISSSAVAYNVTLPLLLTDPSSLSQEASAGLINEGITQVFLVGGPLAVSDSVVSQLQGMGISVLRIAGQDGTDTAQLLAQFELNTGSNTAGVEGLAWAPITAATPNTVNLSRGDFYPDALAGSTIAGANKQPILLTENPSTLGKYTTSFLNTGGETGTGNGIDGMNNTTNVAQGQVGTLNVFGGPLAVNPSTVTAAANAISQG
ncbi:MAG: cell wall-binding repeat-containing protein, partial [Acidimicrobiales bacterium]